MSIKPESFEKDKRFADRHNLIYSKMVKICEDKYPGMHPSDVVSMLRLGDKMTQQQAADFLGVSISVIRRWQRPNDSVRNTTEFELSIKRNNAQLLNNRIKAGEIAIRRRGLFMQQIKSPK